MSKKCYCLRLLENSGLEVIGDQLYIEDFDDEVGEKLANVLRDVQIGDSRLKDELHTLWDKHNRLLDYLGLEDVIEPKKKIIRKKSRKLSQPTASKVRKPSGTQKKATK